MRRIVLTVVVAVGLLFVAAIPLFFLGFVVEQTVSESSQCPRSDACERLDWLSTALFPAAGTAAIGAATWITKAAGARSKIVGQAALGLFGVLIVVIVASLAAA